MGRLAARPADPDVLPPSGPIADIVKRLDSEVDVVVSGHAHGFTNALVPNSVLTPCHACV